MHNKVEPIVEKQDFLTSGLDEKDTLSQKYQIVKEVGHGAFGNVYKALNKTVKNLTPAQEANFENFVAIKKIFYDRNYVQREVPILLEILRMNKCSNIIRLVDKYLKSPDE